MDGILKTTANAHGMMIQRAMALQRVRSRHSEIVLEETNSVPVTEPRTFVQPTLFAPSERVAAGLQRRLQGPGGSDDDGDGGGSNHPLPPLRVVRLSFEPQQAISSESQLFDPLLIATMHRRLKRVLTDVVVVRGSVLVKAKSLRDPLNQLDQQTPRGRFEELVSLARGNATDGISPHQPKNGLPIVLVSDAQSPANNIYQYRFYQTEGPPILLIWDEEERESSLFKGRHGAAISRQLAKVELTELNSLLKVVRTMMGTSRQQLALSYLESFLLKMEVMSQYHPGRFRPDFFDRLWQFIYLVKEMGSIKVAGGAPSPIQEVYQLLSSEIEAALPTF